MNCMMLRLNARRRCCSVIRACAMDTHDGEVESEGYERPAQLEMHPDIRAWCHTRMVFYARGTTNLVRNAVCRRVLGDCTIRQRVRRRNLSCLRCSLTVSRHLHIGVHKWEMLCKRRYCGTLSLGSCQPCELACTHRSGSSPCPHLVTAASTSPQLAVARPCHRRPHARAPSKLPRGAAEQLHDLLIRNVVWVRADNH